MAEDVRHYHLGRRYMSKPFVRFACTVIEDHHSEAGFQIIDADPKVADSGFLDMFDGHMRQPLKVVHGGHDESENNDWMGVIEATPRTSLHFQNAIREVPGTFLIPTGRKRS